MKLSFIHQSDQKLYVMHDVYASDSLRIRVAKWFEKIGISHLMKNYNEIKSKIDDKTYYVKGNIENVKSQFTHVMGLVGSEKLKEKIQMAVSSLCQKEEDFDYNTFKQEIQTDFGVSFDNYQSFAAILDLKAHEKNVFLAIMVFSGKQEDLQKIVSELYRQG